MKEITGTNYVAGKPSAKGSHQFYSFNPKTMKKEAMAFTDATDKEIDDAFYHASLSFKQRVKKKIPSFLNTLSEKIIELDEQLLRITEWETALPRTRLLNERGRTCDQLKKFATFIQDTSYLHIMVDSSVPLKKMNIPIGPVIVFPASNFPFAFGACGGDTVSAWAAGCPVIVKAHPSHPQTSELFALAVYEALSECNIPKGFFSLLHGKNNRVSKNLILHPQAEAIGFTGSLSAGRAIYNLAATRKKPIPVYAEMGSINPIFLLSAKETSAVEIADSITLGVGQFCTKPGVLCVLKKDQAFISVLLSHIKKKHPGILLNTSIKKGLIQQVHQTTTIKQVDVLLDGPAEPNNCSFKQTILQTDVETFLINDRLQDEHFGPICLIVLCKDVTDFQRIANHLSGQLTASIYVDEPQYDKAKKLRDILIKKVGRLIFNGVPTGVAVSPAMHHGGPYPATTAPATTSVGIDAMYRFLRPIAFQNTPKELLPEELIKNEENR